MNDEVKFEEFVLGDGDGDESKYSIAAICAEIEKAKEIAIKEKVFANTILINENYFKTQPLSVCVYYGDKSAQESYGIPPMICGLQVLSTKTLLPDNVAFALLRAQQTEFERQLDKGIEKFANMVAKHLADGFDSPCNYSPLDEEMFDYCGGVEGECECDDAVECWKRVFQMWKKQDQEEAERRWDEK